jgi:hypothetical protein
VSKYLLAETNIAMFLIEENADGIFLYTIRPNKFIADSWHQSIEDAKAQAVFDADSIVGPWRTVLTEFGDKMKPGKTDP